ncbi:MAG: hypothetical protein KME45_28565 [Stenomitos rutilans HA7619-LM2]|nr:hypothetical protein [Stenomitos rutilans HA7619-LM2]
MTITNLSISDYVIGTPCDRLKDWACSYSGYREAVSHPVRRLEVSRSRVILILGFGDRLTNAATATQDKGLFLLKLVVHRCS